MDVDFTNEQKLLRETAARLAADFRADPEDVDRDPLLAARAVAELGMLDMRLAEEAGGTEASTLDAVLVAEEFGHAPGAIPFIGPVLATELIRLGGISAGDPRRVVIGLGGDLLQIAPAGAPETIAWDASGAAAAVVLCPGEGIRRLAIAPLSGGELPSADLTRNVAGLDAAAAVEELGEIDPGSLQAWEAFALTMLSADLVGAMSGALDLALSYAKDRKQFGKPIGAFQTLAHELADAYVLTRAARGAVYYAAWAVDCAPVPKALLAARVAKAYSSQAAIDVAECATQVHGAMGTTWESLCHVFLRRIVVDAAVLGDQERQLAAIAAVRTGGEQVGLR